MVFDPNICDKNNIANELQLVKDFGDEICLLPERYEFRELKPSWKSTEIIPSSNPDSPIPDSFDNISLSDFEKEVESYVVESLTEGNDNDAVALPIENNGTCVNNF